MIAGVPNGLDVLMFVVVAAAACWLACEACWRAEEHDRDDGEDW